MIDSDKLALQNSTAIVRCKLVVKATDTLPEIILTEENAIKNWTYTDERYVPQQGFIGQFVARTLEGNLQNISDDFNIEGREIELQLGIIDFGARIIYLQTEDGIQLITEDGELIRLDQLGEDKTNWYSLGNFIVTNPEDNEVSDNTKFEAMDYAKLFNKKFDSQFTNNLFTKSYHDITYVEEGSNKEPESVTALWLAQYTCAQVGVEFGQETFTNSDFIIDRNPFQAGETCRDVMKYISQLALSWARIDWDNKCYLDFGENATMLTDSDSDTIDNNQYYSLETKKETFGPINAVYFGMENVDGATLAIAKDDTSIAENGEHAIYIYDNPLVYTPELREQLKNNGSGYKLMGLTYNQLTTETVGHPWLKGNEMLTILDMEDNPKTTFPFNRTIEYFGHIKTTLDSMGETEVEKTLAYESEVRKSTKNALLLVDKANARIDALVIDVNGKLTEDEVSGMIDIAKDDIDDVIKQAIADYDEELDLQGELKGLQDELQGNIDTVEGKAKDAQDAADEAQDTADEAKETADATKIDVEAQGTTITSISLTQEADSKRIDAVVARVDSQDLTIAIYDKHINKDTGDIEINEVTTINGYTFNSDGLHIYASDTAYNATIDERGTYYKNGDEIIVETTTDGSTLKNLKKQGQEQYSYNDLTRSYDFIEEQIEIEGEEAYVLFYNGEG